MGNKQNYVTLRTGPSHLIDQWCTNILHTRFVLLLDSFYFSLQLRTISCYVGQHFTIILRLIIVNLWRIFCLKTFFGFRFGDLVPVDHLFILIISLEIYLKKFNVRWTKRWMKKLRLFFICTSLNHKNMSLFNCSLINPDSQIYSMFGNVQKY